ncbi:MAG: hypothetical protein IPL46_06750 [Saprospiraceae bacterium]|nr:hypothetical protein [Saprospiraceae bacterium]
MMKQSLLRLLFFALVAVLPFVILIRGSVYLHETYHLYPVLALVGGFFFTAILLFLYLIFVFRAPVDSLKKRFKLILLLLFFYCSYALLHVSGRNVKSGTIAKEFVSLHPVLRLGVSTILLVDKDLIITDANRIPEDYRGMGLPTKAQSLHYEQKKWIYACIGCSHPWSLKNS